MRILSVDDNLQNLYLIEAVVGAHGYDVVSARNGVEALAELDKRRIDLIVTDILMPEMDGFQLCHEVKSHERTRHIPVIFYSATYTDKKDQELGLALGASRFIIKPMDPEQFLNVMEEVISEADDSARSVPPVELKGSAEYLKLYNARLVDKLDHKIAQLEAAKKEYQALLEARDNEIAQRKRAEEERTQLEAQLLQAQRLESVGRLAGGIAHDFNNLLTVINGYGELALRQLAEGDPLRASIREIVDAGERAARLTRQLLAFSRRQVTNPRPLDVSQVVTGIQNMAQRLVGDDIEVSVKLSAPAARVMADEGQIHQVLMNLIVNARDAMPAGGRLTLETARVQLVQSPAAGWEEFRPGPYVTVTVADNGVGMDAQTLQHIFEPFFTTKGEGRGTGLGLSMVYGIVRQSGGWVEVESRPGRGSTFRVLLPETDAAAPAVEAAPRNAEALRGKETVLVVEDDAPVRLLIAGVLRQHGYQVWEALTGEEAERLGEESDRAIDLLVTDVQMPRLNGPALARRLWRRWPAMRALFVSGCLETSGGAALLAGKGVSYLAKPFTPQELAARVRDVLETPRAEPAADGA